MVIATRPIRAANPFARAAGAVPLCEESQTWRLQADTEKRAKYCHVPTALAGGAAFGEVKNNFNISAPTIAATIIGNASSTRTGWVAGAGAEYAFWSNWSVKLEWLHYDLGSTSVFAPQLTAGVVQPFGLNGRVVTKGDIVWAGLNYKFGGPVVAKY